METDPVDDEAADGTKETDDDESTDDEITTLSEIIVVEPDVMSKIPVDVSKPDRVDVITNSDDSDAGIVVSNPLLELKEVRWVVSTDRESVE